MRKDTPFRIVFAVFLITFYLLEFFPIYWLITGAFKNFDDLLNPRVLFPIRPTLENFYSGQYGYGLTGDVFLIQLRNTIVMAIGTSLMTLVFAIPTSYVFARHRLKLSKVLAQLILFTYLFPATYVIIPLSYWLYELGLMDNILGAILAQAVFTFPFSCMILTGYFQSIPKEIEESALIDGCSTLSIIARVIIPLSAPGLVAIFMYSFILGWNSFIVPLIILNSRDKWTLAIGLAGLIAGDVAPWGTIFAMATIYTIPPIVLFYALNKYMVAGLTKGALKF